MRRAASAAALLTALALAAPALALEPSPSLIIPGRSIGLFELGVTPRRAATLHPVAPCRVVLAYSGGHAERIETNCGGPWRTPERIMVGYGLSSVLGAYGRPDRVLPDPYAGTRADWYLYTVPGIGFRVIYGSQRDTLVQAIAVFRGTGRYLPGAPPPPLPPVTPTAPSVGD